MKYKFKIGSDRPDLFAFVKKPFLYVWQVLKNIHTSYGLMTLRERLLMFALFLISFSLIGYKFYLVYLDRTVPMPTQGGTYTEALVGDLKYLNPILAQSDAEKSVSSLIFSGLIKVTPDGSIVPDLAASYDISADGMTYTFHLRNGLKFSDGSTLTSDDVSYTIESIQTPALKSPLNQIWSGVKVSTPDANSVVFTLPSAYGPFIYSCNFGVMPSGISSDDFSKTFIGSGPYKFDKVINDGERISGVNLSRNDNYYGDKPYIDNVNFKIYSSSSDAVNDYAKDDTINALYDAESNIGKNLDYQSSKRLGLILNLRSSKLKDQSVRDKILTGAKLDTNLKLGLTTLDSPLQRSKAEEIKKVLASQNVTVEVFYFNSVKLSNALAAKNYDLLLYGFDFGYDRDPYTFWHSSQLSAQNFAGWSDKNTDILLEDARMLTDTKARNDKYNQFFDTIAKQSVWQLYDPVVYSFQVKDSIKGVTNIVGTQPASVFENITKWYIKEKRVRK